VGQPDQQTPSLGDVHAATLLLRELIDVTDDFERALGAELSVNNTDLTAMQHLISAGPLSPSELADRLELSSAAVTTVIDRLEGLGHAARTPHPSDRRGVLVVAAPASVGRALGRILPMVAQIDETIRSFSDDEQQVITEYLSRVVETYRSHVDTAQPERPWRTGAGSSAGAGTGTAPDAS